MVKTTSGGKHTSPNKPAGFYNALYRNVPLHRFTAAEVLAHPWVVFGGDNVGELCTPAQLRRTSVSNLSTAVTQINQHCRTINANTTDTTTNAGSNKADPLSYSHR